ncbi:MAG: MFS transporter [Legionellaceae bacterium]|nr:MFS transporter [Legionellaceae bacterium]
MKKKLPILMSFVIFTLTASFYFYDYFLQVAPGVIAKSLKISFSIGAVELGVLSAFYYLSYTAMQIPAGLLFDRYGGRAVVFCATFATSLGALLFGLSDSLICAALSRLLIGAGSSFAFLGALYFAMRWFPGRYFATLAGMTALIGSIGAVFGDGLLGYMLKYFGWRNSMIYISIFGFVLSLVIGGAVRNHPYDDKVLTKDESRESLYGELRYLFSHSQVWALGIYGFLTWSVVSAFAVLWGIPFLRRAYDMTLIDASIGVSVLWVGVGLSSPLIGWFSDYIKRRKLILIICPLFALVLYVVILYGEKFSIPIIYTLLFFLGTTASGVTVVFATAKDNVPIQTRNLTNGLINMMVVLSGLIMQPLIGFFMNELWSGYTIDGLSFYFASTYRQALLVLPISSILSLIVSIFWIKETNCVEYSSNHS